MKLLRELEVRRKRGRTTAIARDATPPAKRRKPPELQYVLPETKQRWLKVPPTPVAIHPHSVPDMNPNRISPALEHMPASCALSFHDTYVSTTAKMVPKVQYVRTSGFRLCQGSSGRLNVKIDYTYNSGVKCKLASTVMIICDPTFAHFSKH